MEKQGRFDCIPPPRTKKKSTNSRSKTKVLLTLAAITTTTSGIAYCSRRLFLIMTVLCLLRQRPRAKSTKRSTQSKGGKSVGQAEDTKTLCLVAQSLAPHSTQAGAVLLLLGLVLLLLQLQLHLRRATAHKQSFHGPRAPWISRRMHRPCRFVF